MASKAYSRRPTKRSNRPSASSMAQPRPLNSFGVYTIVLCLFVFCVFALLGVSSYTWFSVNTDGRSVGVYSIEVVREFPHDPNAFTQGLLYGGNDTLFESTGLNGRSSVRKVALQTGKTVALHKMDYNDFGEGLTLVGERLFQVTWLKNTGFMYDRNDLSKVEKFTHQMEDGWGLATDGKVLFGSDGSSTLYQIDPETFKVIGKQIVKYNGHEVHNLNELEFINGEVWANVWMCIRVLIDQNAPMFIRKGFQNYNINFTTDCIARISHKDGLVLGWVLLQNLREGLLTSGNNAIDVLNGIAWDSDEKRIFVTGKLWPKLYEVKLQPAKKQFNDRAVEELCLRNRYRF